MAADLAGSGRFVLVWSLLLGGLVAGCAEGSVEYEEQAEATATTSSASQGGSGAASTGGSGGSVELPCGIDCAGIDTPPCQVAECNMQTKQCEVVPEPADTPCDDGVFCTVSDACDGSGMCAGGPANDCGMTPGACEEVSCDESTQSCSFVPLVNGAPCTDPQNLCLLNPTCLNGSCQGTTNDCFFAPVPDDCHVAECNPMNGMCEPVIGNEGGSCTDVSDLCTIGKTCMSGVCQGGSPKDCSQFTQGCNLGVCDTTTGSCTTTTVMNGQPCDDLNPCTSGELCNNGTCAGGSPVTQCLSNDACCPMGCTEQTDSDCGCGVNLALTATPTSSGGGSGSYGPGKWNDGVDETGCVAMSCASCQGWITNGTSPGGKWMQYTWSSPVQIGSIWVDTNACTGGCYSGRNVASGEVQYWNGTSWVTATSFTGQNNDFGVSFNPKLTTTQLRLYNVTTSSCGQGSNSLMYEWYVFAGTNCQPPP